MRCVYWVLSEIVLHGDYKPRQREIREEQTEQSNIKIRDKYMFEGSLKSDGSHIKNGQSEPLCPCSEPSMLT